MMDKARGWASSLAPGVAGRMLSAGPTAWRPGTLLPVLFVFLYYLLMIPPWKPQIIDYRAVDGAWQIELNRHAFGDISFGRDFVFSLGPLGFLRAPVFSPHTYVYHLLWGALLAVGFTIAYAKLFRHGDRLERWRNLLLFLLLPLLSSGSIDRHLYLTWAFFLFLRTVDESPRLTLWEFFFMFLLAAGSWIIFTQFLAAACTIFWITIIYFAKFKRLSPAPLIFGCLLLTLWLLLKQPLAGLVDYLHWSLEIARGYNDVLARYPNRWEVGAILTAFAGFLLAMGVSGFRDPIRRRQNILLACGLCMLFFIAFRAGFVRQARPRITLTAVTLTGMAAAHLATLGRTGNRSPAGRRTAAAAVALSILVSVSFLGRDLRTVGAGLAAGSGSPRRQVAGLLDFFHGNMQARRADRQRAAETRASFPLPRIEGPVDLFDNQQGILLAHGLEYRRRPVMQSSFATRPALAELNRRFYQETAPPTVVVCFSGLGSYPLPLLDARLFPELLESYAWAGGAGDKYFIARKVKRRAFQFTVVIDRSVKLGEWVSLAPHAARAPVWVEVDVEETVGGKLARTFFKPSPLWLAVGLADGSYRGYRLAAGPLRGGFWLSPTVDRTEHFAGLMRDGFAATPPDRIVQSFRVHEGHQTPWARRGLRVRAFSLTRPDPPPGP